MNLRTILPCCVIACASTLASAQALNDIPHLEKRDGMTKLIVDGRPYICVAGELTNTASSDREGTKAAIARMAAANLNTVLTVVSWDLVEPREGHFDFSMIDYQIEAARASNVRLVFLWMGSWKNGLSHFPPTWVKANQERFPRVVNGQGRTLEILSTLSEANRNADARAFAAVMNHIREVDSTQHTVIAIQVENEVGAMGTTRDFCDAANQAFNGPVPAELTNYLQEHKDSLLPEMKRIWDAAGDKTSGTWEEVFGKNVPRPVDDPPVPNSPGRLPRAADAELFNHTDEIFMAWNYSRYIGYVAAQGKKEYALPMYVNTWIVQPNDIGAGDYPSGGPEALVHDIWRAGGPAIDILAPDIYLPQYAETVRRFARNGNPAFNPECRQDADNAWMGFTELNLLCSSPFGIDNLSPDSEFARAYGFINSVSGAIAEAQNR
ncbi:MAG: beta-galactosidase, partial [Opitutaceae bacterium]